VLQSQMRGKGSAEELQEGSIAVYLSSWCAFMWEREAETGKERGMRNEEGRGLLREGGSDAVDADRGMWPCTALHEEWR